MILLTPDLGFIFWHTIILCVSLVLLGRYAWKPILQAIKAREQAYEKAIAEMQKAQEEVTQVEAKKEKILQAADTESNHILQQAIESKEALLKEAEEEALKEKEYIINNAFKIIELEKQAAQSEIKKHTVALVLHTTEKLITKELIADPAQQKLIQKMITEVEQETPH
jgi:F-type H+-transporting ATPase subunit b